jgi:hypothetical protein
MLALALAAGCSGKGAMPSDAAVSGDATGTTDARGGTGGGGTATPGTGGAPAGATGGSAGNPGSGTGGIAGPGGSAGGTGGAGGTVPGDATPPLDLGPADGPPAITCTAACTAWGEPQLLGNVGTAGLDALSGLAASWRNPGVVYVHNDRNRAELFALGETAALVARLTLSGATVQDIEDVEVSRCPAGTCLYLADIGDNASVRTELAIYRATEPMLAAPAQPMTLPAERFAFRYADQPHNAESLLIDSLSGAVYVITKVAAGQRSAVYHLTTFETGRVNMAVKVADLPVPAAADTPATAGSAHPCGGGFLLRTNNTLYEFRTPLGTPLPQAFAVAPVAIPVGKEVQGEAVGYRADGRAYYTTSEGTSPPLHRVSCK